MKEFYEISKLIRSLIPIKSFIEFLSLDDNFYDVRIKVKIKEQVYCASHTFYSDTLENYNNIYFIKTIGAMCDDINNKLDEAKKCG